MHKILISTISLLLFLLIILVNINYSQKQLTVQAIYGDSELRCKSIDNIQWVPHKQKFSYIKDDKKMSLWIYDIKTGSRNLLLRTDQISVFKKLNRERRITPSNYFWSPNGNAILINSGNDLNLYDINFSEIIELTTDKKPKRDPIFSPDGKKIAFIKDYNLHVLDINSKKVTQLTTTGQEHILIGQFDWVYEEEFGIRTGFCWSPDSRYIAFFQLDESLEPEFPIVDYIPVHTEVEIMRYPKAGDHNALVKIGVVTVEDPQITWMDIGTEFDIYIPRIKWLNDSKTLAIYRMNRQQNRLELLFADICTGKTKLVLKEKEEYGWIDINDDLAFVKDSDLFVWSSDRSGFTHLYLYNLNGKLICPLTQGNWDVTSLVKVDAKKKLVYFMATKENIFERHLYKVDFQGRGLTKITQHQGNHAINMHPDCTFYLDSFSNFSTPTKISLHTADGKMKNIIEPNEIEALNQYQLSIPEIISFTPDNGTKLNAAITKPVDFNPTKKYPVIFSVYGGPGSQTILNKWGCSGYLWRQLLTQKGYIIFELDNRGTGYRGSKYMKQMYRKLGYYEVADMINGVKYLHTLPYIDSKRIGIWGWSYGGYTTIMCMLKAADYFKVGVAVAPVTDWRNYDTIYTERYMDTPRNNHQGYENSSAIKFADKLEGKLLLIHGSADDNVHLSNTMQLAYEFQKLNKPFDLMIYPRKMHGIREVKIHLFNKITDYFLQNL